MTETKGHFAEYTDRNPAVRGVLQFLEFDHLPAGPARDTSMLFARLACDLLGRLPDHPELTKALDKLREAKDRAVGLAAVSAPR